MLAARNRYNVRTFIPTGGNFCGLPRAQILHSIAAKLQFRGVSDRIAKIRDTVELSLSQWSYQ